MPGLLFRWLTLTAAVMATAYLLKGIHVDGFGTALLAAALLGVLNASLRPITLLLTLPINILSLGLFTFIINALMLKLASAVIPGFDVRGFWTSLFGALIISLISWLLNSFVGGRGRFVSATSASRPADDDAIDLQRKGDNRWE